MGKDVTCAERLLCHTAQVKRIDYYQRTDQALSQFLSGASAHSLSTDVTTYLHGDGLLTLRVARLPEGQELPGADTDQVWFWLRPRQVRSNGSGALQLVRDVVTGWVLFEIPFLGCRQPRTCVRMH